MIAISTTQWKALADAGLLRFADEMVEHLSEFAPELAEVMDPQRLQALVQRGIARAKGYGFTNRGPLRSYLETMLALGSDFDTDPALVRATAALRGESADQLDRAARLHAAIGEYCDQVNGPDNQHALAAMRRVQDVPYDAMAGGSHVGERALALFRGGFPQKYDYAGDAALRQLLIAAARISGQYEVRTDTGKLVIATMLYSFGHGVFSDPAYAWVAETMRNSAVPADERPRHLHRRARTYLGAALANLAQR